MSRAQDGQSMAEKHSHASVKRVEPLQAIRQENADPLTTRQLRELS